MSTYEPGTVAVATVRGVENVRVMAGYGTAEPRLRWLTTDERLVDLKNDGWYFAYDVTDVRPLVVLDIDECYGCWAVDQRSPSIIAGQLRKTNSVAAHAIADQIEAQTKPPRIPEPGPWGVVEAGHEWVGGRCEWVRVGDLWFVPGVRVVPWDSLVDPTLIREGVES